MTLSQWLTGLGAALTVVAPVISTQLDFTAGVIIGAIGLGLTTFNSSLRHPTRKGRVKAAKQVIQDAKKDQLVEAIEDIEAKKENG